MLDLLQALVQLAAVAGNLAEVLLYANEFLSGAGLRVFDDGLGKPHLAGELEGEGIAGKADFQGEHGGNL